MSTSSRARLAALCIGFAALFAAPSAHAQTPSPGFFYVGMSGGLGMKLSGLKLFAGYDFGRGSVELQLYGGVLAIPPGPGAGIGLSGKYYILDDPTWRAGAGADVGVIIGGGAAPVLQIKGIGEARRSIVAAYLELKTGFPQIFGAALGGKLSFADRTAWIEANTGMPLLINGEVGYTTPVFK